MKLLVPALKAVASRNKQVQCSDEMMCKLSNPGTGRFQLSDRIANRNMPVIRNDILKSSRVVVWSYHKKSKSQFSKLHENTDVQFCFVRLSFSIINLKSISHYINE